MQTEIEGMGKMRSTVFSNVVVFGKEGCKFCELAKDKLQKMDIPFEYRDLLLAITPHDGWRDDGTIEISAAYDLYDRVMPIISIDGNYFTYPMAMRYVKEQLNKTQPATVPVQKEGKLVCALAIS